METIPLPSIFTRFSPSSLPFFLPPSLMFSFSTLVRYAQKIARDLYDELETSSSPLAVSLGLALLAIASSAYNRKKAAHYVIIHFLSAWYFHYKPFIPFLFSLLRPPGNDCETHLWTWLCGRRRPSRKSCFLRSDCLLQPRPFRAEIFPLSPDQLFQPFLGIHPFCNSISRVCRHLGRIFEKDPGTIGNAERAWRFSKARSASIGDQKGNTLPSGFYLPWTNLFPEPSSCGIDLFFEIHDILFHPSSEEGDGPVFNTYYVPVNVEQNKTNKTKVYESEELTEEFTCFSIEDFPQGLALVLLESLARILEAYNKESNPLIFLFFTLYQVPWLLSHKPKKASEDHHLPSLALFAACSCGQGSTPSFGKKLCQTMLRSRGSLPPWESPLSHPSKPPNLTFTPAFLYVGVCPSPHDSSLSGTSHLFPRVCHSLPHGNDRRGRSNAGAFGKVFWDEIPERNQGGPNGQKNPWKDGGPSRKLQREWPLSSLPFHLLPYQICWAWKEPARYFKNFFFFPRRKTQPDQGRRQRGQRSSFPQRQQGKPGNGQGKGIKQEQGERKGKGKGQGKEEGEGWRKRRGKGKGTPL